MFHRVQHILPHPEDKSPAPLRPTQIKNGTYTAFREPYSTEVRLVEPDGESYLLEFFEFETFLTARFGLLEERANKILDLLWNFGRIDFDRSKLRTPYQRYMAGEYDLSEDTVS